MASERREKVLGLNAGNGKTWRSDWGRGGGEGLVMIQEKIERAVGKVKGTTGGSRQDVEAHTDTVHRQDRWCSREGVTPGSNSSDARHDRCL